MQIMLLETPLNIWCLKISADEPLLRVKNPESQSKTAVVHIGAHYLLAT